ncbi:NUMOD4 motif-containing HNH endonuclease [Nocardia nova]|uniref:NUMOD4 motif-containing HNH endonuclease n=1 Tax=Nocardia nova TaxID=37330 RepID=UPI001E5C5103|nr:NUMOD4 motif-containing HNH endonuclease [Nocardia nova]
MHYGRWRAHGSYDCPVDNTDLPGEIWRPIPGYESLYQASSLGRVRALPRKARTTGGGMQTRPGRIMRAKLARTGYLQIHLRKDDQTRYTHVHRLVCEAFHGLPSEGQEVRHLDGDRSNNVPANLAWGSSTDNAQDKILHGTQRGVSQTHCIRGHALDAANVYVPPKRPGQRYCKTCARMRARGEI